MRTKRSEIMHSTYAHWYVYFVYGNHYCLNITCGKKEAGAVLIREIFPVSGVPLIRRRRGAKNKKLNKHNFFGLCDGPGKICQAFGVDNQFNGQKLGEKLWIEKLERKITGKVSALQRVGGK